ncbi:major facilitator transporter [Amycolatopsis japonica]|uniref:Major facilitator transporter n=2 Tax=Pseudonocardiaceae TaxID=2070 RepID=A0A075UUS5_9PSEU|nr:major facilitator transporter [Amycolatopsis japonica]
MTTADVSAKAGWREWLGLLVLCLPTMLTTVDISAVFLSLPHISADLGSGATEQLWIVDIYGFLIAGFLVTMGTLGDKIGRRKVLMIGAVVFIIASILAAYSTSTGMLIVSRALLGIAGATVAPTVLALLQSMFKDPKQMATAMAAWGTAIMLGVILGPVIGGLLLGAFWWGSIFLMAVPVMLLLLIAGPILVPESRNPEAGKLDLFSVALSLLAILPLIFGLKEMARGGVAAFPIIAVVVGAVSLVVFIRRQRALANPLLDLSLFSNRTVSAALIIATVLAFVMGGIDLMASLHLQLVEGLSPVQIGVWLLIPSFGMVVVGNIGNVIAQKVKPGYVLAVGCLLAAVGMVVLTQVSPTAGVSTVLIGITIIYLGGSPAGMITPYLIMSSTPPEKAGSAGSLQSTGGEFGVALGVAVAGLMGTAVYRGAFETPAGTPADVAGPASESIAGAFATAGQIPGEAGANVVASAKEAFSSGVSVVAAIMAALMVGIAVLAATRLRHVEPTGSAQAAEGEEGADGAEKSIDSAPESPEVAEKV